MLQLPACSSTASWQQLKTSGCMSIPDVLLHVPLEQPQQGIVDSKQEREQQHEQPDHGRQQQLAGLLLVGSKCSSSQVLGLPRNLWSQAMSSSRSVLPQQQQWVLPVLQSALLPSLAGAQAVAVYTDPSGVCVAVCAACELLLLDMHECTVPCEKAGSFHSDRLVICRVVMCRAVPQVLCLSSSCWWRVVSAPGASLLLCAVGWGCCLSCWTGQSCR